MVGGAGSSEEAIPQPPWHRSRRAQPARQPLSQTLIVTTALRIIDQDGLDGLSMRRVADELGTGPASLYAHVKNKEELLALMLDRITGEIQVPEPDPARWQEQIKELARQVHRVMTAHADIALVSLANIPTGPNALRLTEGMLSIMLAGGLPPQVAAWAIDRLALYIGSDAYEGSLHRSRQRASGRDPQDYVSDFVGEIHHYLRNLPTDLFPYITANVDHLTTGDGDQRFEFGLDLIVDGLSAHLPAAGGTERTPPGRADVGSTPGGADVGSTPEADPTPVRSAPPTSSATPARIA